MSYKKLKVWLKAMEVVNAVYEWTRSFPSDERFGLVSQMRRAAVSIASNIAEGSQRTTDKDFANFILMSKGSLAELETQILVAVSQKMTSDAEKRGKALSDSLDELSRMLHSFHSKLTALSS